MTSYKLRNFNEGPAGHFGAQRKMSDVATGYTSLYMYAEKLSPRGQKGLWSMRL